MPGGFAARDRRGSSPSKNHRLVDARPHAVRYRSTAARSADSIGEVTQTDDLRRLLIDYHYSLALSRELALKLLDVSEPNSAPLDPAVAGQHRRLVGEALARIEDSENFVESLWKRFGVDRRQANPAGAPPVAVERRKARRPKSS
jgi:hypothetical protein